MAIWVPIVFLIGLAIGIHEGYKHGENIGYLRGRRDEWESVVEDFWINRRNYGEERAPWQD